VLGLVAESRGEAQPDDQHTEGDPGGEDDEEDHGCGLGEESQAYHISHKIDQDYDFIAPQTWERERAVDPVDLLDPEHPQAPQNTELARQWSIRPLALTGVEIAD